MSNYEYLRELPPENFAAEIVKFAHDWCYNCSLRFGKMPDSCEKCTRWWLTLEHSISKEDDK